MAAKLLTEFAALAKRDGDERPEQQVPAPKLTDREMQVLKLVAKGMNNRDIARNCSSRRIRSRTTCGTSWRSPDPLADGSGDDRRPGEADRVQLT